MGAMDKQASTTSLHLQSDLGGEVEGQPIRRGLLAWLVAQYQGDKVGVADLGVLPCYPEMSDVACWCHY